MKLKVVHKLFLALLLSTSCALITMAWLAQRSLDRGFVEYINQRENERLGALIARLESEYQNHGWQRIGHANPRIWRDLVEADNRSRRPPPPRHGDGHKRPPRHGDEYKHRPPRHHHPPPRRGGDPFHIGPRITLFDHAKQRIIGRAGFTEVKKPIPLLVNNTIVGWLGIRPLENATDSHDINFLSEQSRALIMFACALIILAALLAFFLARHLVRPLRDLAAAAQRLAAGAYDTRVSVIGHDEIAELARDFNSLAHSLQDNRQARQRWVADISHELRTPLAVMRSELEALQDGIRPLDQHAIQSLHSEILRINKLVHDLHELSLSDLGALTYKKTQIDLRKILQQAASTFETRFLRHDLRFTHNLDNAAKMIVNADRDRLLQLLANLFENSIRYTDAGGELIVTATQTGAIAQVEIADSAPGVAADECDKLFERLYRVDSSRSRTGGGSGLGLAICHNIVAAHDGSIRAQASHLGGLSVIIELPLDHTV